MALITLIRREQTPGYRQTKLVLAGLRVVRRIAFLGDSMITPARSPVLSAVEGLKVHVRRWTTWIMPSQRRSSWRCSCYSGSARPGSAAYSAPGSSCGLRRYAACRGKRHRRSPRKMPQALSPTYALSFFFNHFSIAFFALAAVVLAVTGAEAVYADMGRQPHAGVAAARVPRLRAELHGPGRVDPGQPGRRHHPVLPVPNWGQWPFIFLATPHSQGDHIPGGHHRRFGRPPGQVQFGYTAEAADCAHLGGDHRPDLRPVDQLAACVSVLTLVSRSRHQPRSRSPSEWRSPARSRSRFSSSTSFATSGSGPCGWS